MVGIPGNNGVIVGKPTASPGTELGGDTDSFEVLIDGRKQKSTFTRKQLAFPDDRDAPPEAAMPSAPAARAKGGKGKAREKGAKSKAATSKGRGKRGKHAPIPKACANDIGVADESTSAASPLQLAQKTSARSDEEGRKRAPQAGKRRVPDADVSGARMSVAKKAASDEESVSTEDSDVEAP